MVPPAPRPRDALTARVVLPTAAGRVGLVLVVALALVAALAGVLAVVVGAALLLAEVVPLFRPLMNTLTTTFPRLLMKRGTRRGLAAMSSVGPYGHAERHRPTKMTSPSLECYVADTSPT